MPVHAICNYNREKFDSARGLYPFLDAFGEADRAAWLRRRKMLRPGRRSSVEVAREHSPWHVCALSLERFERGDFLPGVIWSSGART